MFFTFERTEEDRIAVLSDDCGAIYNISLSLIPQNSRHGDVFRKEDGKYIFNEAETNIRRMRIKKKKDAFFGKIKNK